MTKKDWLRNFANSESWYAKDLQEALAEWDQLEAENIALKECLDQYREDFSMQNEGIAKLQDEIALVQAQLQWDEDVRAYRIKHGVNSNPPPPAGIVRPDPPPAPPRERK